MRYSVLACFVKTCNPITKGEKNKLCEFKLQVTLILMSEEDGELEGGGERFISKHLKRILSETCHILGISINLLGEAGNWTLFTSVL